MVELDPFFHKIERGDVPPPIDKLMDPLEKPKQVTLLIVGMIEMAVFSSITVVLVPDPAAAGGEYDSSVRQVGRPDLVVRAVGQLDQI